MKKILLIALSSLLLLAEVSYVSALSPTANLDDRRVITLPEATGFSFASISARDTFFAITANRDRLKAGIPITVNEGNAVTTFRWTGDTAPVSYDASLFRESSLNSGPGTLFLGIDGTNISSSAAALNFESAYGIESVPLGFNVFDSGSSVPGFFEFDTVKDIVVADVFDTQLSAPREFLFPAASLSTYTTGVKVRPAITGTLVVKAFAGALATDPIVVDATFDIQGGDIGNIFEVPYPNKLLGLQGDIQLLTFDGVDLFGGLQTSGLFTGQTKPFLIADTALARGVAVASEDDLDDYISLNSGYITAALKTGGIVVSALPTALTDTFTAAEFTQGVDTVSNPSVATAGAATFAVGDIVRVICDIGQPVGNNAYYEVLSHAANLLTVRGVGTTAKLDDFTADQFVNQISTGTIIKVGVSVLKITDTDIQIGFGNSTPITYSTLGGGDGIYSGNGTVPTSTVATITDTLSLNGGDLIVDTDKIFVDVSNQTITIGNNVTGTDRFNVFGGGFANLQTGIAAFYNSAGNLKFRLRDEFTTGSIPPRIEADSNLGLAFNTTANAPFVWYVNGTANEEMRLTSTGLAIGAPIPESRLHVQLPSASTSQDGIRIQHLGTSPGSAPILQFTNAFPQSYTMGIEADEDAFILAPGADLSNTNFFYMDTVGRVAIGTTTTAPAAILTLASTTRGFAPPRMTNAQILLIASPFDGLKAYSLDDHFEYQYDASRAKWLSVDTTTYQFGSNGSTDNTELNFNSTQNSTSGVLIPRDGTVISVTGMQNSGNTTKGFEVRANGISIFSYVLVASEFVSNAVNADFSASDMMHVFSIATGSAANNPTATVTVRWRL